MIVTAVAALALIGGAARPGPAQDAGREMVFEGLGSHGRVITTRSRETQRFFNQGLAFLYAFNHDESIRSFKAAIRHDPKSAMAWWGLALANGPHINNPVVPKERERAAVEAMRKARAHMARCTAVEKALILATEKRYRWPQPESRAELDKAFADAMRQVWKKYPNDADVGTLFAEAMMDLRPWDFWKPDGTPQPGTEEITATLTRVLELNPKHPQANHLAIHAWEASLTPERAIPAADALRDLQPGLGHMVHMPSHIDVRVGSWQQAIVSNQKAIAADEKYRARRPKQGFYRLYMSHNRHMLAHAAMMSGQSKLAIQSIDEMIAAIPVASLGDMAPVLDGYLAMPYEVRIRFGKWDEILALPEIPEPFVLSRALRHAARGVAYAAKGDVPKALEEERLFAEARKKVPESSFMGNNTGAALLAVAEPMLRGEILLAEKKMDDAITILRSAVAAEDQLRYDEPPDWINPVRHPLGAALMAAGRYDEAAEVYREDLKRLPNNGWSLYGLAQALRKLAKNEEADAVAKRFEEEWKSADLQISSSCLCLPG